MQIRASTVVVRVLRSNEDRVALDPIGDSRRRTSNGLSRGTATLYSAVSTRCLVCVDEASGKQ